MEHHPDQGYLPAGIRADVRLGRLDLMQAMKVMAAALMGVAAEVYLILNRAPLGRHVLALVLVGLVTAEFAFGLRRRLGRWLQYRLRPRWRRADASEGVASAEGTVQALVPVTACRGPFLQFRDGWWGLILRVEPDPDAGLTSMQRAHRRRALQVALRRAHHAGLEVYCSIDLEPDLHRTEWERQAQAACHHSPALQSLLTARHRLHEQMARTEALRPVYHLRLLADSGTIPYPHHPRNPEDRAEMILAYLRDHGQAIGGELSRAGLRTMPLGPEALRDLLTGQLDPAGWLRVDSPRGTDWAWPAGEIPRAVRAEAELEPEPPPGDEEWPLAWPEETPLPPEIGQDPPEPFLTAPEQGSNPPGHEPAPPSGSEQSPAQPAAPEPVECPAGPGADVSEQPSDEPSAPAPDPPPPAEPASPRHALRRVVAAMTRRHQRPAALRVGPMERQEVLAVLGADRKQGTTQVAAALALGFRARGNSAALVALDGRNDLLQQLGLAVLVTPHDWERADESLWIPGPRGMALVPSPTGGPVPETRTLNRVLGQARRHADAVIVDLGASPEPDTLVALQPTGLLIVTTTDRLALQAAHQRAEQLLALGFAPEGIGVALNRARSEAAARELRGCPVPVALLIPEDPEVEACQYRGSLPSLRARGRSPFADAVSDWVARL